MHHFLLKFFNFKDIYYKTIDLNQEIIHLRMFCYYMLDKHKKSH